jgi:phosphoribosylaminoimidazolecarboxamide formyltransferase/IMP cyclohydrolase
LSEERKIRTALLSVTDKSGLPDFARALADNGVRLISTGGTARTLREAGLTVEDISDLTGFPEMLDGRVKTLHPKVHGGLLFVRSNPDHVAAITQHGITPIDMVVVNLYAFEKTAQKPGVKFEEIIENIDIGGPSMIRSAAKNFHDVTVVTSPADYDLLAAEMDITAGAISLETRWRLARAAFSLTADYDSAIASTLESMPGPTITSDGTSETSANPPDTFPPTLRLRYSKVIPLRYGENPHQGAALYADGSAVGIAAVQQLQGKELSFNNLVDLDACWELVREFDEPAVAIIKHTNPCGAATGEDVRTAYLKALAADPVSAFGSVIGINRPVDAAAAEEIARLFVEAVVAPDFSPEARAIFSAKKNLRLVIVHPAPPGRVLKQVSGGVLLQDADTGRVTPSDLEIVTQRCPTAAELASLLFAWRVCKHVKSNAIVYAREGQTLGIGAGQMSRVDAARFGAMKALLPLIGCVAASDAYFPFPDGMEAAVAAGATAIIQPGGSVRDPEVIAAADRLQVAMVFTRLRHFRH